MTFRRTESGLSNFYLFVDADAVVFVEGGLSFNREAVDNGDFTSCSSDIRFWQTLFTIYRPEKNFQFRSIGSKETVKSIALDIKEGRVSNVVVAMDRDFDHLNSRIIASDDVLYTRGYSWENDVWESKIILEAFCTLSGSCKNNTSSEADIIDSLLDVFSTHMSRAVLVDAILSQHDNSFFDRAKPGRYIEVENNGSPNVNLEQVKVSLIEARNRNNRPTIRKSSIEINSLVDCFGHLLADYAYRILAYLIEKVRRLPKLPKEYATVMVVEKFAQVLEAGGLPSLKQHYDTQFKHLTP